MTDKRHLEHLVTRAVHGDKEALEKVAEHLYKPVYNLALRMLRHPDAAEDAAQEILIKVVTNLGSFRGESAFTTWVFRLASNHILSSRERDLKRARRSFSGISEQLSLSLGLYSPSPEDLFENSELTEEVKRGCTLGMLAALSEKQRLALILGEIYELNAKEAAFVMEVSPEAYRKQLSRARADLISFVRNHCGVVNEANACRCHKHVKTKLEAGQIEPHRLAFAPEEDAESRRQAVLSQTRELAEHRRVAALIKAHPTYEGSGEALAEIKQLLASLASPTS